MIRNAQNIYNIFPSNFPKDITYSKILIKFEEGDLGTYFSSGTYEGFLMCSASIWKQIDLRILQPSAKVQKDAT